MSRAEPALSRTPLHLSAVVGAAIRTGITTPVTPSGPPPQSGGLGQGVLPTGGCAGTTTLRLTWLTVPLTIALLVYGRPTMGGCPT